MAIEPLGMILIMFTIKEDPCLDVCEFVINYATHFSSVVTIYKEMTFFLSQTGKVTCILQSATTLCTAKIIYFKPNNSITLIYKACTYRAK